MKKSLNGFTLVELLIVIVVIAILAAISVAAYNGISARANESRAYALLTQAQKYIQLQHTADGTYPETISGAQLGDDVQYVATDTTYCAQIETKSATYSVTASSQPTAAECTLGSGGTTNVALGANASSPSNPRNQSYSLLTNGNTSSQLFDGGSNRTVTVDLGSAQIISKIIVWHYYNDGRTYNDTKTEISADGTTWKTIFDSSVSGTYKETAAGHTISFFPTNARYIRDSINGSSSNGSNHWYEIMAY